MWNLLKQALVIVAAFLAGPAVAQTTAPLVGTWKLVRYVDTPAKGDPVKPFGDDPIGYFIFTADGHASINILRHPNDTRRPMLDIDPDGCVPDWYCSYFGTYSIDSRGEAWAIKVVGGNIPSFLGTEQRRRFRIAGDHLLIEESYIEAGIRVRAERQLVRAK